MIKFYLNFTDSNAYIENLLLFRHLERERSDSYVFNLGSFYQKKAAKIEIYLK